MPRSVDFALLAIQCEHRRCIAGVRHGLAIVGQLRQSAQLGSTATRLLSIVCGSSGPQWHNAVGIQVDAIQLRQVATADMQCAEGIAAIVR